MVNAKARGIELKVIEEDFDRAAIKRAIGQFERINKRGAEFNNGFTAQCFLNGY